MRRAQEAGWIGRAPRALVFVAIALFALIDRPVSTTDAASNSAVDRPAVVTRPAARGRQSQINPPSPPPLPYPSGVCDGLTAGLPGLQGTVTPTESRLLGHSVQGRPIWAEYWGPANPTSTIVVIGQVHGNECAPSLLVDEIRRNPPRHDGIWLIPTINPDGYAAYSRRNANDVDLNADGGSVSQPETRALFGFIAAVRPELTIHVHSPNGFVGTHPVGAPTATTLCTAMTALPSLRCSNGGAGHRPQRSTWFLWQGLQQYGGESLLIELRAVSDSEVPTARPRPPTLGVEQVRSDARHLLAMLDQTF